MPETITLLLTRRRVSQVPIEQLDEMFNEDAALNGISVYNIYGKQSLCAEE